MIEVSFLKEYLSGFFFIRNNVIFIQEVKNDNSPIKIHKMAEILDLLNLMPFNNKGKQNLNRIFITSILYA